MRLDGAVVLVTGASSGIGAAAARLLARKGARLLVTGRNETALRAVGAVAAGRYRAELGAPGAVDDLAAWALNHTGHVDVLVANAGIGAAGPLVDQPPEDIEQIIAVNLTSAIQLTRLLLPGMLKAGRGHLVFVSSIAGAMGVAGEAAYSASKAGLHGFAESVRHETAGTGVAVSTLLPGIVDTAFFARRGVPIPRSFPRPVTADAAARALVSAIESGRQEVFVPRWLRFPARLHGAAPALANALQRRFG